MVGRYNRVGKQKGPLVIGGALSKFEQDPNFVYVPMYKVAGPKDEIEEWLRENHPEELKTALKSAYSKASLKTSSIRSAFEAEVEQASKERQEVCAYRQEMKQVNLMVLVNLLQLYDKQKRSGELEEKRTSGVDMKSIVKEAIRDEKFIDVTALKAKGGDWKKISVKKGSTKRHLSQDTSDPLYRVVYNPTTKSSVKGVENFMKLYGNFTEEQVSTITSAVESGSMVNINKTRSPTRSPMLSPKSRRGKGKRTSKKQETEEVVAGGGDELDELLSALPVS